MGRRVMGRSRFQRIGPLSRFAALVAQARKLPAVRAAVVHPCDRASLEGAMAARALNMIDRSSSARAARSGDRSLRANVAAGRDDRGCAAFACRSRARSGTGARRPRPGDHEGFAAYRRGDERSSRAIPGCAPSGASAISFVIDARSIQADAGLGRRDQHCARSRRKAGHRPECDRSRASHRHSAAEVALLSAVETVTPKLASTVERPPHLQDGRSRADRRRRTRRASPSTTLFRDRPPKTRASFRMSPATPTY